MLEPAFIRNMTRMRYRYTVRTIILVLTLLLGWMNIPAQSFRLPENQNLWPILSERFNRMPEDFDNTIVQHQIDADLRHPKYIHMLSENARPYLYYVFRQTEKKHMPAELALLPMIESDYIPYGYSNKGAEGLWQLMPSTADDYGIKMNYFYDGRRSTATSTKAALSFLSYLYGYFNHNWLLALAAYNAGPGTVMAAIHYNEEHGRPTNFWALPLPQQTKEYIPKLLALAAIIQHPHEYGVNLAPVPDKAVTGTVEIKKETSLTAIAHMANTTVTTVKKLNPALTRSETPPHQIVKLVLPADKKPVFVAKLAEHKAVELAIAEKHFKQYSVQHGDTLDGIAEKYKTTVAILIKINQLHNDFIRLGQKLLVPGADIVADTTHVIAHHAAHNTTEPKTAKKQVVKMAHKIQPHHNEHTYIVRSGDNLHRLAAEFHTTTYHIMVHNHLRNDDLQIGQRLLLPNA